MSLLILAIPGFVALMLVEMLWSARTRRTLGFGHADTIASISMGLGSIIAESLLAGLVLGIHGWVASHALWQIGWAWWAWPICYVGNDFAYYWAHRTGHRVRWFWASHVAHHSSQYYNLSTAVRQSWTSFISIVFAFYLPLTALGFAPEMILTCGALNMIYQYWIHTEAIGRMPGWFEALFNTPSHHRVHHAINPVYLDRNFGGTFMLWDRLFGTFQAEREDEPVRYGIVQQLQSFNLLVVAFHEWKAIAADVCAAPWGHKLSYLWREPGWSHDGSRETSEMIRARAAVADEA